MHKGFTLTECLMTTAILLVLVVCGFLNGIPMATKIATENAQLLAADSLAWDAIWKTFNVPYENLPANQKTLTSGYNVDALTSDRSALAFNGATSKATWSSNSKCTTYELPKSAAPELWIDGSPAILLVAVALVPNTNDVLLLNKMQMSEHSDDFPRQKRIYADVEWGPKDKRMRLSDYHTLFVDRSGRDRVPWEVQ